MKTSVYAGVAMLVTLAAPDATLAAEYYVATDGNDSNPGSEQQPFATVERGQQAASPGDTVWVRGGTYAFSSGTVGVRFTKAGQAASPIHYFAYPGEVPVFDLSAINPSGRVTGFDVNTNHLHIRGMEITGVPQFMGGQDSWALRIQGSNNIIELMNVHHNEAPGIFITSGADNLILNCDSHHNYDVLENGGSGDGFGCHSTGGGNVMRGCRAWENSDDGYDFINAPGVCAVEASWSWRNGWIPDTNMAAGNGAGFKAGGFGLDQASFPQTIPVHVVTRSVAWNNRAQGFYANHHPGRIDWFNNTAYDNPRNYDMLDDVGEGTHLLRNNVAFGSGGNLERSTADDSEFNSWDGGVSLTEADFQSLSDDGADGPRADDGSLPSIPFLRLAPDSDLIDAGEDVGLSFNDAAPDLGAFETGDEPMTDGGTAAGGTSASLGSTTGTGGTATGGVTGGVTTGSSVTSGSAGAGGNATAGGTNSTLAGGGAVSVGGAGPATSSVSGSIAAGGMAASSVSGSSTVGAAADDAAGCACSLGSRRTGSSPVVLLGVLGLLFAWRAAVGSGARRRALTELAWGEQRTV